MPLRVEGVAHRLAVDGEAFVLLAIERIPALQGLFEVKGIRPQARERFRCRGKGGRYRVLSESIIRDCLIRRRRDPLWPSIVDWCFLGCAAISPALAQRTSR